MVVSVPERGFEEGLPQTIDATIVVFGCPPTIIRFQPKLFKN